jgi:hypothetical protein
MKENQTGLPLDEKITVCDKCLRSSCWHAMFLCDEAYGSAGTTEKTVKELIELNLEHQDYFSKRFLQNRGVL